LVITILIKRLEIDDFVRYEQPINVEN